MRHFPLPDVVMWHLKSFAGGAFGDVIRQSETGRVNQLLDILRHKALTQMAQESGGSATVRLNTLDWLGGQGREQADNEWHDAINWLGDWCSEEQHPVIWSTTQAAEHLPVRMPRLCSAERLSESMVDEIFQKGGCMSTEMKTGLVLSGGGAVGAYQAGVVKALAECGTQNQHGFRGQHWRIQWCHYRGLSRSVRSCRTPEALWDHLGNNQVLSVNRLVYFFIAEKNCSGQ